MLFLNRSFDKKRLKALLLWFRLNLSEGAALKAVELLQELGFRSATQGAISLGLDDLKTPTNKSGRVFQAQLEVALAHHEHYRGNRTPVELFQHLVDTWHRTSQDLTTEVVQLFHSTERVNPVYMMAFSGARGNISQVRQLVGMRGLMADPRGQIVGFPILSNFREGLTITEYFVSCYGARKGVVDTAIRTADAGYLTRRLADVSHHVVVRTTNCGTHRSIQLRDIKEGQKTILSLASRLVGRVLAEHLSISDQTNLTTISQTTPTLTTITTCTTEGDDNTLASQSINIPKIFDTSLPQLTTKSNNSNVSKMLHIIFDGKVGWVSKGVVTFGRQINTPEEERGQCRESDISNLHIKANNTKVDGVKKSNKLPDNFALAYRNSEITPSLASKLGVQHAEVSVRSPLTCSLPWGVCQLCYGWGLSEGRRVTLGEAVGIIAAQSIGEPGTQLTLRTFHTGGVFSGELLNEIRSPYNGTVIFSKPLQGLLLRTPHGQIAFLTKVSGKMKVSSLPIPPLKRFSTTCTTEDDNSGIYDTENNSLYTIKDDTDGAKHKVSEGERSKKATSKGSLVPERELESDKIPKSNTVFGDQVCIESKPKDIFTDKTTSVKIQVEEGETLASHSSTKLMDIKEFVIQPSTVIFVKQKEQVYQNQLLAEFSSSTLQSANDQIEITQQVLSETAGQVWFKELDYGNRKGPGSGFLGTHFSSQRLGGIWVLAGESRVNTLAFNDRQIFSADLPTPKLHTHTQHTLSPLSHVATIPNFGMVGMVDGNAGMQKVIRKEKVRKKMVCTISPYIPSISTLPPTITPTIPKVGVVGVGESVLERKRWYVNMQKSFRRKSFVTFLHFSKGNKVIKLLTKWQDFVKYQKTFKKGIQFSFLRNQVIHCKIPVINLRYDKNFLKYRYLLGYSQRMCSIKLHSKNVDNTLFSHNAWWLSKKWKTNPGVLMEQPFFLNKKQIEGQVFWLSNSPEITGVVNCTKTFSIKTKSFTLFPIYQNYQPISQITLPPQVYVCNNAWKRGQNINEEHSVSIITKLLGALDLNYRKSLIFINKISPTLDQNLAFENFIKLMYQGSFLIHSLKSPIPSKLVTNIDNGYTLYYKVNNTININKFNIRLNPWKIIESPFPTALVYAGEEGYSKNSIFIVGTTQPGEPYIIPANQHTLHTLDIPNIIGNVGMVATPVPRTATHAPQSIVKPKVKSNGGNVVTKQTLGTEDKLSSLKVLAQLSGKFVQNSFYGIALMIQQSKVKLHSKNHTSGTSGTKRRQIEGSLFVAKPINVAKCIDLARHQNSKQLVKSIILIKKSREIVNKIKEKELITSLITLLIKTKLTATKQKTQNLLTIDPFWQILSLMSYPSRMQYIEDQTNGDSDTFNTNKSLPFFSDVSQPFRKAFLEYAPLKLPDVTTLFSSFDCCKPQMHIVPPKVVHTEGTIIPKVGMVDVIYNNERPAKILRDNIENNVNVLSTFPLRKNFRGNKILFINQEKKGGKNKSVLPPKPIWLSVSIFNNSFPFFSEKILTSSQQQFSSYLEKDALTNNGRKKHIKKNESILNQHIVYTINLPIVPFPYIIQNNRYQQSYRLETSATISYATQHTPHTLCIPTIPGKKMMCTLNPYQFISCENKSNSNSKEKVYSIFEENNVDCQRHKDKHLSNLDYNYNISTKFSGNSTCYYLNDGTTVQGNFLPLLRESLWKETFWNLANVRATFSITKTKISHSPANHFKITKLPQTTNLSKIINTPARKSLLQYTISVLSDASCTTQLTQFFPTPQLPQVSLNNSNIGGIKHLSSKIRFQEQIPKVLLKKGIKPVFSANTTGHLFNSTVFNPNFVQTKKPILGISCMHLVTLLPLKIIQNIQGRYTSTYVKEYTL